MEADRGPQAIDVNVLRGSALLIVLRPAGPWQIRLGLLLLACGAILKPRVLHSPWLWLALALVAGARLWLDWPLPDNHLYLLAYWCLALGLALLAPRPAAGANLSARLLIGSAFAFAVLWKAFLSPDFRDGRFFSVTLLNDPRLTHAALFLGGLSQDELQENRHALQPWPADVEPIDPPQVYEPPSFRRLVLALTWGTIALESLVALSFLAPLRGHATALRHGALLAFCAGTYALAPVAGFAWLLLVMGLAAVERPARWLPRLYLATAMLVLVWAELPWGRLARSLVAR
jgi:hypothetical protein